MAKLVIAREDLPPINGNQNAYFVRFRITTDDKNLNSYWSNVFKLERGAGLTPPIGPTSTAPLPIVNHQSGIVTVAWQPQGQIKYDVWYSWSDGTGQWVYFGRTEQTGFITSKPSGVNKFSVEIYEQTQENNRNINHRITFINNVGV